MIEKLGWDSSFFGYNVGRIFVTDKSEIEFLKNFTNDYKLIYVFTKGEIELPGLKILDRKVLFNKKIIDKPIKNENFNIEPFNPHLHNFNQLNELALLSGKYSRFNIDRNFKNNEYLNLYNAWIRKSVDIDSGINTYVAYQDKTIMGFITLLKKSENLTEIGLVAVSKLARGMNCGSSLISYATLKSLEFGCANIQVTTQLDNLPAVNFYKKNNFNISNITNIYHIWNI